MYDNYPEAIRLCPLWAWDETRMHYFKTRNPRQVYCSDSHHVQAKMLRRRDRRRAWKFQPIKYPALHTVAQAYAVDPSVRVGNTRPITENAWPIDLEFKFIQRTPREKGTRKRKPRLPENVYAEKLDFEDPDPHTSQAAQITEQARCPNCGAWSLNPFDCYNCAQ